MDSPVLMWIRWTTLPETVMDLDYLTDLTGGTSSQSDFHCTYMYQFYQYSVVLVDFVSIC